jgi:hypothetical protein
VNLGTMRTAVLTRMGLPSDDALLDSTSLTAFINAALHHIETLHDWRWLEVSEAVATTAGDNTYALASNYRKTLVDGLTHSDGELVRHVPVAQVDVLKGASGPPKVYAVYGAELVLGPNPDATYNLTHRYVKFETDLANDADEPTLPVTWHQALVEYAAYLGFRRINSETDAGAALAAFDGWRTKMLAEAGGYSVSEGGGAAPAPPEAKA